MSWFGKKSEPPPEEEEDKKHTEEQRAGSITYSRPIPAVYYRALREPLFDTEWCVQDDHRVVPLFQRPMGQTFFAREGYVKNEFDTNMTQPSQLPTPLQFDWYDWRMEFSPDVPLDLVANFRFCSRLQFAFGQSIWFSYPLSYVPCSMLAGIEELRQAVSVLSVAEPEKFEAAWAKAKVVTMEDRPKDDELPGLPHEIYRTETARKVCGDRPWRIRSCEVFGVSVATDWKAGFDLPESLAVRLYFEGCLYRPI